MATFHFEKSPEPSRLSGVEQMAFNFQLDVPVFFFLFCFVAQLVAAGQQCLPFSCPKRGQILPLGFLCGTDAKGAASRL